VIDRCAAAGLLAGGDEAWRSVLAAIIDGYKG
jgi:hypothetical protein